MFSLVETMNEFKPELLMNLRRSELEPLLRSNAQQGTVILETIFQLDFKLQFPQKVLDEYGVNWAIQRCGCHHGKYHFLLCSMHGGPYFCFFISR